MWTSKLFLRYVSMFEIASILVKQLSLISGYDLTISKYACITKHWLFFR